MKKNLRSPQTLKMERQWLLSNRRQQGNNNMNSIKTVEGLLSQNFTIKVFNEKESKESSDSQDGKTMVTQ